jgi:AcrR family transcriptional regulator
VSAATRPPGRPRSAEADAAILRAALELLAQDGYRALTMEAVRERAGVGKATLYRRYGSKDELVRAAIAHLNYDLPLPADTGSLEDDFAAVAAAALEGAAAVGGLQLMPRLLAEVADDPAMHRIFSAQLVEPRRRIMRELLRRAQQRGEVRTDLDLDLGVDLIVGPLIYRVVTSGGDATKIGDPREVLRAALQGLSPR